MSKRFKEACLSQKHGRAEVFALLLYILGVSVVAYFHEPWFDEAQAWQIARCASLREILFEIPHYEGHPQLWHLLLVPFAKLGAPYELTMFSVNFAFCLAAVALLLWKSPFPKIVRCLIPFSYFFFYQYGVLSRPYSIMMLAFMLVSMTYQRRNERPLRYILSLGLLCASSAYGILVAGGLCIVWTLEIIREYWQNRQWSRVLRDGRAYALFGILIFALILIASIMPAEDCYYSGNTIPILNRFKRMFYVLILPFDSLIGCYINVTEELSTTPGLIAECIGGVLVWAVLLVILHANHKKLLFLVPYFMYSFFSIFIQFSVHHLGISTLMIMFIFWVMLEDSQGFRIPPIFGRINAKIESKATRVLMSCVGVLAAAVTFVCSAVSSYNDILYCYGAKNIVDFLKENNLDELKIMVNYSFDFGTEGEEESINTIIWDETLPAELPSVKKHYPYLVGLGSSLLPYFDENIIMNFNADDKDCMYLRWIDAVDPEEIYASWREQGLPDVIIGLVPLNEIYSEEELEGVTYYWVETFEFGNIWKLYYSKGGAKIYIRSDLLEEYPQFEIQKY